jgi:hypothetical protein
MGRRKHHWQKKINHRLTIPDPAPAGDVPSTSANVPADVVAKVLMPDEGFPINVTL